jgi:aspartyl-tRNA(Asn)/glutamyl-tRNA(Gln) amidotransferase subunit C
MKIDISEIERLAELSRLRLNDDEKYRVREDMQRIIGFIDKLQQVDTTGIEPLVHVNNHVNVLRDDIEAQSINREDALKNAPSHDSDFFKIPKVLKK